MAGIDYSRAVELLTGAQSVALCGHINPDGDCLGSVLALTHALRAMGKSAQPLLATAAQPANLDFMPGYDEFVPAASYEGAPDLFVMVDVPNEQRMADGAQVKARCGKSLKIDHHAGPEDIVDAAIIDIDAAAVGVMVWELIEALPVEPTPAMAQCCYAALITDTGSFRYQNADARAFASAAGMVAAGADPATVATNIYQRKTIAAVRLEALVGERIRTALDGRCIYSWMTCEDLERLGATKDDTEELTDVVRQIAGPEVSVILRKNEDGSIRGSIRSKGEHDVQAIAMKMGGGGHKAASGFTLHGDMRAALQTVVDTVAESYGVPTETVDEL